MIPGSKGYAFCACMKKMDRKTINKCKKYIIAVIVLLLGVITGCFAGRQTSRSEHKNMERQEGYM